MKLISFLLMIILMLQVNAQKATQLIEKGNASYRQKEYTKAKEEYLNALQKDQSNSVAQFNSGNASARMNKFDEAAKSYEAAANTAKDPYVKAQAFYNQGVSYIRQNKLVEAIDAFKKSLRLNPNDDEARDNLQRALRELQKQQQPKDNDKQNNKNKKNQKDQPQKPQSRMSEEEADRRLKELAKEEKNLQKQVQKKNQSGRQLKDW